MERRADGELFPSDWSMIRGKIRWKNVFDMIIFWTAADWRTSLIIFRNDSDDLGVNKWSDHWMVGRASPVYQRTRIVTDESLMWILTNIWLNSKFRCVSCSSSFSETKVTLAFMKRDAQRRLNTTSMHKYTHKHTRLRTKIKTNTVER